MLLAEPQAALLDEPFSKLDKALRGQFRDWVFEQLKLANVPTCWLHTTLMMCLLAQHC
ncbi:ABC transporter ATP-binding protein YnjD [Vibrio ponticus]|nr:ABC transporter ATP-binding protein YnjD [Vibrio ponticus]